jgi:hypothetical protein
VTVFQFRSSNWYVPDYHIDALFNEEDSTTFEKLTCDVRFERLLQQQRVCDEHVVSRRDCGVHEGMDRVLAKGGFNDQLSLL